MIRPIPSAAIAMNRSFESLRLDAYSDGKDMAIGYGHDDPNLKLGDKETEAKADSDNLVDLEIAGQRVQKLIGTIRTGTLTEGQWGALVDFAYNAGTNPAEPIWEHVLSDPGAIPSDLSQAIRNSSGVVLGGLILRRKWQTTMWNAVGLPTFTPPVTADYLAAHSEAASLNNGDKINGT
jgi:GH24 family phage-related lysozyme (muramidase)